MAATAIRLLRKPLLLRATPPVILLGSRDLLSRVWVDVDRAEFLPTLPAPGAAAAGADLEGASRFESTGKDIVAGSILQSPALAPRALLRIT